MGEVITVVSTFVNGGEQALNISFIVGSLNNPANFAQYYQNTSGTTIGEVVEPGMEVRRRGRQLALNLRSFVRKGESGLTGARCGLQRGRGRVQLAARCGADGSRLGRATRTARRAPPCPHAPRSTHSSTSSCRG